MDEKELYHAMCSKLWSVVEGNGQDDCATIAADTINALRTQLAEEKAVYREVEERLAAAMSLLDEVATSSTSPHRDGPGCWWCTAEAGQPHEPGCKYAALSASGAEVLARGRKPRQEASDGG